MTSTKGTNSDWVPAALHTHVPEQGGSKPPNLYPLFLRLEGVRVVVVGAGSVAMRKIDTLLRCGATITVVAPDAVDDVCWLAEQHEVLWLARDYQPGDLEGALIAIAATNRREVNEAVYAEACDRNMLVNVVDVPNLCNFFVPALLNRGHLQLAVTTGGAAPSVARAVREQLEEAYPAWWEGYLDCLADVRTLVKERVAGDAAMRRSLFGALASREVRNRFEQGWHPSPEELYDVVVRPIAEGGEQ